MLNRLATLAAVLVIAGCSGDGDGNRDGGGGAAGAVGGAGGRGAGGSVGGASGPSGVPCGAITCSATQFCDWAGNTCAGLEAMGTCRARPQACTMEIDRVCGCDGAVYSNPCAASSAGEDISEAGGCTAPAGSFACGPRFCMKGMQFCEGRPSGMTGVAGTYMCKPLPAACGTAPACACLSGVSCAACVLSAAGDLTTACPP